VNRGDVARLIDHTLLRPDATRRDIETVCAEAREHRFAAVCINPVWVHDVAVALAGSSTAVCTVVGFPLGATTTAVKVEEARAAIAAGAHEIDTVIKIGHLKSGDLEAVRADVEALVAVCRAGGALSKVIIEAALLTREEKIAACGIAAAAGADFVKTSTGFGPGGATVGDVTLMRAVVGPAMGIKAAGGIRHLAVVEQMVRAGATRIGTSAGVQILAEAPTLRSSRHGDT
jgi:deoxyribose-phosphate aldolase